MSDGKKLVGGLCSGTLSSVETTGFYATLLVLFIFNFCAYTQYLMQYQKSQMHPAISVHLEQLDTFPSFSIIVVPFIGNGVHNLEAFSRADRSRNLYFKLHHELDVSLRTEFKVQNMSSLWWIVVQPPLLFKRRMCLDDREVCGVAAEVQEEDTVCEVVEKSGPVFGGTRKISLRPCKDVLPEYAGDLMLMPTMDIKPLLGKVAAEYVDDGSACFVFAVPSALQADAEATLAEVAKFMARATRPRWNSETGSYLQTLEESFMNRFPLGTIVDATSRGIVLSSRIEIDSGDQPVETFKTEAMRSVLRRAPDHWQDCWRWSIRVKMKREIISRSATFTLFNALSCCISVLQLSLIVFKFLFPSKPMVPFFFRYGAWRKLYKIALPANLSSRDLFELGDISKSALRQGSSSADSQA